jgi:hypothetical protein
MASVVWIEPVPAPDLKQQLLGNLKEAHVQQTFISTGTDTTACGEIILLFNCNKTKFKKNIV